MKTAVHPCGWVVLLFLTLGSFTPAHAQIPNVQLRLHGGVAKPFGDFAEYFSAGPAAGLDVVYPFRDRLDLLLDLDLDYLNNGAPYLPDTRLWRYRVGVESPLLGGRMDNIGVAAYAGAGATTFRSKPFVVEGPPSSTERFSGTYFTGTTGLRLALGIQSPITWWVSGELNWTPMAEEDTEILRRTPANQLSPFGSATNFGLSLGASLRPARVGLSS